MAPRSKKIQRAPWPHVCSLLERMAREMKSPIDVLDPLGDFERVPCDDTWDKVVNVAARRGGRQHIGEAIGDVLQEEDDKARVELAFCQTPGFVTEYLIDHTIGAFEHFGPWNDVGRAADLDQRVRMLDPSCGAGHILVRAVRRIAESLRRQASGLPSGVCLSHLPGPCIKRFASHDPHVWACDVVSGYDLNPQVAAIARVRLAVELHAGAAPNAPMIDGVHNHIVEGDAVRVRDSLLDPGTVRRLPTDEWKEGTSAKGRFEMIVANPPYVTPKDPVQREAIRERYESAHAKYGMHGPFLEAMLEHWLMPGGFCASIVGANFMKREWGRPLIEKVLPRHDLRVVVNACGAFLPGHGTPTIILMHRGYAPTSDKVMGILSKKGEPGTPEDPAKGVVWQSFEHIKPGTVAAMRVEPDPT